MTRNATKCARVYSQTQIMSLENIICIETLAWLNLFVPGASSKTYEKEEEGNLFAYAAKTCPLLW